MLYPYSLQVSVPQCHLSCCIISMCRKGMIKQRQCLVSLNYMSDSCRVHEAKHLLCCRVACVCQVFVILKCFGEIAWMWILLKLKGTKTFEYNCTVQGFRKTHLQNSFLPLTEVHPYSHKLFQLSSIAAWRPAGRALFPIMVEYSPHGYQTCSLKQTVCCALSKRSFVLWIEFDPLLLLTHISFPCLPIFAQLLDTVADLSFPVSRKQSYAVPRRSVRTSFLTINVSICRRR